MSFTQALNLLIFTTDPRQLLLGAFVAGWMVGWWLAKLSGRVFQTNASPAPAPGPKEG